MRNTSLCRTSSGGCFEPVSGLPKDFLGCLKGSLKAAWKLPQDCLKPASRLLQDCLAGRLRRSLKAASRLPRWLHEKAP